MANQLDVADIISKLKEAQLTPIDPPGGLGKATFAQAGSAVSGLTYYDLELGAKLLYPVLTPLRNQTPRVSGKGGIQAAWRAVTAINSGGLRVGVSVGHRNSAMAMTTTDYTAAYKGLGIESTVDFEAQYAGMGFEDIRALGAKVGLEALMIGEEIMILGGDNSAALGTTPTPTGTPSTTGGTLAAGTTYSVICVALALDAVINGSVTGGIQASIARTNLDASSDTFGGGAARKSAASSAITTTGATGSIAVSVAQVAGAMGYAWFWGPTAGSEVLGAITGVNSYTITATATGTQTAASLPASDQSTNTLAFDGFITIGFKGLVPVAGAVAVGTNGTPVYTMATGTAGVGTPLTADGAGGIQEIDTVLKYMWDQSRLGPDTMWVNSQEALNISKKILAGSTTAAQRFVFESVQDMIGGGIMVRTYLNRFSMAGGSTIDVRIHPNMPAGTVLMTSKSIPYPISGVSNAVQVRTRQEYYQIEWPLTTRQWQYGVYADEVLQCYAPFSNAIITNISNG